MQEDFVAKFIGSKDVFSKKTIQSLLGRSEMLIKLLPVYFSSDPWRLQTLLRLANESPSLDKAAILKKMP